MEENRNTDDQPQKMPDATGTETRQEAPSQASIMPEVTNDNFGALPRKEETITETERSEMEVHKHPHHVMHKKKWSEYLLEFFMLFLAVFLGFIAENIREHIVEKRHEKEFAFQLTEGLKEDTASLNHILGVNKREVESYDSIALFLSMPDGEEKWNGIYRHIEAVNGAPQFVSHQASFDQIQNTGALRYFGNQAIVRNLMEYKFKLGLISHQQSLYTEFCSDQLTPFVLEHFNENWIVQRFHSHIPFRAKNRESVIPEFAADTKKVGLFQNIILQGREDLVLPAGNLTNQKKRAEELISMLEKEYHFKE